ncbi:serine/threonine-protein kinase pim-2-like [Cyclopterus lumpus]|uniref:serine/threonine-protein kinase pim-2-like n=1 Tax=Cyclopterus lumpus TaxID=8103 RepID=UPI0014860AC5|nr:serine/threonine-protein kinase pim-2-like [Cyclopterus lumpus]XP_034408433.1 serine/threonine-protein kinase pim-2-like [Cyclopterus lumpus]
MDAKTLKTLHPLDSEKDLEHTTKPSNCVGTDCRGTKTKRPATINRPKPPRKRQRSAGEPTETKRTKRTACTEREVPEKKPRVGRNNVDTGELIEVPVEGLMAHGTKRKAGTEREVPEKKPRVGRNNVDTGKLIEVPVEGLMAHGTKRKAGTEREVPEKKPRVGRNNVDTGELIEVPVEGLMAHGTKRKAGTESATPGKKKRGGTTNSNTSEPTKVSVESARESEKKKVGAERPPETETPRRTRKGVDCDLSKSSSSPSTSQENHGSRSTSVKICKLKFEDAYLQLEQLGEGSFGSVYAGERKTDNLPVAIKRILKVDVESRLMVFNGRTQKVPIEALLMLRAGGGLTSVRKCAAVSLIDWYDLDQEVLLIMERPVPCVDLLTYLDNNNGPLSEDQAKDIMKQLVEAAIQMLSDEVFHRDIKTENVLIETDSDVPRVRIIDFGCGCFVRKRPYCNYSGTSAYAPPEFYLKGKYKAGPTTVWQLGALLFELLDGHKQFITSEFLQRKISINSELSQDCHNLLQISLAINPRRRATLQQMQLHPWFK